MSNWKLQTNKSTRWFWINEKAFRMMNVEKIGGWWVADMFTTTKDYWSDRQVAHLITKSKVTALKFAKRKMKEVA